MAVTLPAPLVQADWEAFGRCILRQGQPRRVHLIELFLDSEVEQAVAERFGLLAGLSSDDPYFLQIRHLRVQQYLGYDYVCARLDNLNLPMIRHTVADSAGLQRAAGRTFVDLHQGPIASWDDFEKYPWPRESDLATRQLEWFEHHVPDNMCIIGRGIAHYAEWLSWLMGYETLCYALFDQPDLVQAIYEKIRQIDDWSMKRLLQFDKLRFVWGSDDMGFRTGTLISPQDLRRYVLPGHKTVAQQAHQAGRPYLLHCCGQVADIMDDLIEDVKIDAKHSFEDAIQPPQEFKKRYGHRVGVLGGIDVDFLCRADEAAIRCRVRQTLDQCMPGGGYCLGSGNSIANYIPLDHYLAMLDEGRKWT